MDQSKKTSVYKKIISTCLALIFLSTAAVIVIGFSIKSINTEKSQLQMFLTNQDDVKINFEKSLEIYTGETKEAVFILLELRPETEGELVRVISEIEKIGQDLRINIDLKSMESMFQKSEDTMEIDYIEYSVSFYGTMNDLQNLLRELEQLLNYTQVEDIEFEETKFLDPEQLDENPNIKIRLKLYIK